MSEKTFDTAEEFRKASFASNYALLQASKIVKPENLITFIQCTQQICGSCAKHQTCTQPNITIELVNLVDHSTAPMLLCRNHTGVKKKTKKV